MKELEKFLRTYFRGEAAGAEKHTKKNPKKQTLLLVAPGWHIEHVT